MLRPENVLDKIVKTLKSFEEFSEIRFIYARKAADAEKPVENFFVACGVGRVHKEKDLAGNRAFTATLEFQIYAPCNKGGRELSKLCISLMEALDRADSEGEISDIKICDLVYDKDLCTLTQKVEAQLLWEVVPQNPEALPQSSTVEIVVNGKSVQVLSAKFQEFNDVYVLRELLLGDTDRHILKGRKYRADIAVETIRDPFEKLACPDIILYCADKEYIFKGCVAEKVTQVKTPKETEVREYSFLALSREVCERNGE